MSTPPDEALRTRISELEARVGRLEEEGERAERREDSERTPPDPGPEQTGHTPAETAESETAAIGPASPDPARQADDDDPYWVLAGLEDRYPDDDVVLYGGTMSTDGGGYRWQYGLPTQTVLDGDFADAAPALSALAHPVRLALLQAVLTGTHATADLAALPGLGTSGQVYHHLNQLSSAGWLRSPRRGRWEVPGERTIPLLALVMAATT
ncbi:MAG: ArsR/SmtB family transcription factor [Brevibacterium yomogidense]|uniref:ArsR/SmtB family transcription factor n=1 Tax=Brevibacterium sp. Mu109 TaxID=1255669 RepID=UPI000C47A925|nr:helix-turn-helix domain-containing protein [Brevibacterium sp. Mu109]SMX83577.1 Helix-turn-helix domain-containing protein [Brevibacterium sp. Mu109]